MRFVRFQEVEPTQQMTDMGAELTAGGRKRNGSFPARHPGKQPLGGRPCSAALDPLRTFASECDQDRVGAHYEIRPVLKADLAMLGVWRSRPHVSRWWGAADVEPEVDKLRERRVAMWIAERGPRPFAFVQDYGRSDWSPHHFDFLPPGSRGVDMYIGGPGMLGVGHGSRLLRRHADRLLDRGAPALGVDPHPDNLAAIRAAFGRAGFGIVDGPVDTRWGRAVLMARGA